MDTIITLLSCHIAHHKLCHKHNNTNNTNLSFPTFKTETDQTPDTSMFSNFSPSFFLSFQIDLVELLMEFKTPLFLLFSIFPGHV